MKKLLALTVLAAAAAGMTGCSDPCGDLEDICGRCDAVQKVGCDFWVAADDSDACDAVIDQYTTACP